MLYIRDINVFMGLIVQRERLAKGLYLTISLLVPNSSELVDYIKSFSLVLFSSFYIINCFFWLFNKKIKFYQEIKRVYRFVIVFLFFLITNFQPWYFMWLSVFMIWQKSKDIKLIIQMQLLTLVANIVFLIYSENFKYGPIYFLIFVFGIGICELINRKFFKIKKEVK